MGLLINLCDFEHDGFMNMMMYKNSFFISWQTQFYRQIASYQIRGVWVIIW